MLALFTDEQVMLGDVVSELANRIGLDNPGDLGSAAAGPGWSEISSMGLNGLRIRAADHVPVGSGVEVMIAAEAFAGHLVPQPYLGAVVLPGELLALVGAESDLEKIATGEVRGCVLLRSDTSCLGDPPYEDCVAWDCAGAEFALAVDQQAGTVTKYSVQSLCAVECADLTREVAKIVLGECEQRWDISAADVDKWFALALVVLSADIVGAMRGGLMGAVEFSGQREQYGVPIASFQALQHLCAEALVKIEGSASTLKYAAWAVDELPPSEALLAARTAKAFAAGVAREVGESIMQVYGGIGQTWDHIAHFYLRRLVLTSQVLGDATMQLEKIVETRLGTGRDGL